MMHQTQFRSHLKSPKTTVFMQQQDMPGIYPPLRCLLFRMQIFVKTGWQARTELTKLLLLVINDDLMFYFSIVDLTVDENESFV